MAIKTFVPTFKEFDGWQGMLEGSEDGYGNAYVLKSDYEALHKLAGELRRFLGKSRKDCKCECCEILRKAESIL